MKQLGFDEINKMLASARLIREAGTVSLEKKRGTGQMPLPDRVIYSDPATIVLWDDGTKTVVKAQPDDGYDPDIGLLLCIAKRAYGNKGWYNDILKEWRNDV